MSYALIKIPGKGLERVTARQFTIVRSRYPDADLEEACDECKQPFTLNDQIGASGFATVNSELVERGYGEKRPWFNHPGNNNGVECSSHRPVDPRFPKYTPEQRQEYNHSRNLERARNEKILNGEAVRTEIADTELFLMQLLTGENKISEANRKRLDRIKNKYIYKIGIAQNPWVVSFIKVVVFGSYERQFAGEAKRVQFIPFGTVRYDVRRQDGKCRKLETPRTLRLCYIGDGDKPVMKNGEPVIVEVSARFSKSIAEIAAEKRLLDQILDEMATNRPRVFGSSSKIKAVQIPLFK